MCRVGTEAPLLERAAKRYDDRVVFIGVDVRDFNGDAKDFVAEHDLTYLIAYDGPAKLWEPWGITGLPETFFVDRNGTIVDHKIGEITERPSSTSRSARRSREGARRPRRRARRRSGRARE